MDNKNFQEENVKPVEELEQTTEKKDNSYKIIIPLFVLLIFISIGFSYLSTNLKIFGSAGIDKVSWDVHFDNIEEDADNTVTPSTQAIIQDGQTSIQFASNLQHLGDKYGFEFDIKNDGTIDAMIETFSIQDLSAEQAKHLEYKVTYANGEEIRPNDLLKAGEKVRVHVTSQYKEMVEESQSILLVVDFKYIQADDNAVQRD